MNSTSNVKFNIINEAVGVSQPTSGIIFVEGVTLRGPIADPSEIITSPKRFRALFGDINISDPFPLICMEMLTAGAFLRVNRVAAGTPAVATSTAFADGATPVFQIIAKYAGVDYNNVKATVGAASNGDADSFNLTIEHLVDTTLVELYENIKIVGNPNVASSDYLSRVTKNSTLVSVVYSDLSGTSGQVRPDNADKTLSAGSDGTTPAVADYIGAQADQDGFYAFDPYDDSYALVCPAVSEDDLDGLTVGGATYAGNRKDLVFYAHLSTDNTTATALIAAKPAVNTEYVMLTSGGRYITHPISGEKVEIPEIGMVLAQMAKVHREYGEWYAFFGPTLGALPNTLGAVNNFGSTSNFADLNLLAQRQINMVVTRNNLTYLADAYTTQTDESPTNHVSVVNLLIYMKKALKPLLETFLGLPLDILLMTRIYLVCKAFMDNLVRDRALFDYSWEGDQFATSLSALQVNDPEEVGMGRYKINLRIIPISPLKEITVNIIITRAGVSFTS